MKHAFLIGGDGQIGRAAARMFVEHGWNITIAGRSTPQNPILDNDINYINVDRKNTDALKGHLRDFSVDFLLDCLSFDEDDATQLADLSKQVGKIAVISSASVYTDEKGRSLDEAYNTGFPVFPAPISTKQATVRPSSATYSTKKIAMEQKVAAEAKCPVNILRPCAIYGPHSKHAREWFFVKRLLEGRTHIPMAYSAESQLHTTSVENLAAAIFASAAGEMPLVSNIVDPIAPTVREIGLAIMNVMGVDAEIIGLPGKEFPPMAGRSPWAIPSPFICELSNDYVSVGNYEELIAPTVEHLIHEIDLIDWKKALPQLAVYPIDLFDYASEDKIIAEYKA